MAKVCLNYTKPAVARSSWRSLPIGRQPPDHRSDSTVVVLLWWAAGNNYARRAANVCQWPGWKEDGIRWLLWLPHSSLGSIWYPQDTIYSGGQRQGANLPYYSQRAVFASVWALFFSLHFVHTGWWFIGRQVGPTTTIYRRHVKMLQLLLWACSCRPTVSADVFWIRRQKNSSGGFVGPTKQWTLRTQAADRLRA